MVGQQFLLARQLLHGIKEVNQQLWAIQISRLIAQLLIYLSQARTA